MNRVDSRILDFFDRQVSSLIMQKYGFNDREALRSFIESETYKMLFDSETDLYTFSPLVIFDMWESEKITGSPRNSQYVR
ncbi:MAG: hypothetical protein J5505_01680 [Spirochaetaceae bacterium]|nr:hypothetical protein [Spirochaetaceae bacterium]